MHNELYDILMNRDEITWQTLIYDLIKSERMDPWDVDISLLTKRYLETLRLLKEANFLISGKVLLAASLLLKIKSDKLVNEDFANFDALLYPSDNLNEDELYAQPGKQYLDHEHPKLTIRTPLARKRKVNINDLIFALQKALEVDQRKTLRKLREREVTVHVPEKKIDISHLIKTVYEKIVNFFKFKKEILTFDKLIQSDKKEDKIFTFIPLLHLDNQEKINLIQEEPFGEIKIEKTVQESFKFYIILAAFSAIMGYIMFLIFGDIIMDSLLKIFSQLGADIPETGNLQTFGRTLLGYLFSVIGSFVSAAILYLWLLIFKGNEGYQKSYQLYVYSTPPHLLFSWIPVVSIISWIYSFALLVIGTRKIYNFSNTKSVLIYLIPLIILFIIGLMFFAVALAFLSNMNEGSLL